MWVKEECNVTREFLVCFFFIDFVWYSRLNRKIKIYPQFGPDLQINNIQTSDSGTYICLVSRNDVDAIQNKNDAEDPSSWSSDERFSNNDFYEILTIILKVRSTPGPVARLSVRLSTILGVLMWEFYSNHSGGYPIKSFTAEFRKFIDLSLINSTEHEWHRFDPQNIPANVVSYDFILIVRLFSN